MVSICLWFYSFHLSLGRVKCFEQDEQVSSPIKDDKFKFLLNLISRKLRSRGRLDCGAGFVFH